MNANRIYIQDESKNTNGTWKDRRSKYIIQKARKEGVAKLCLITSGNAGYSLSEYAKPYKIKVVCVVDKNLSEKIKNKLRDVAYKIIEVDLSAKLLTKEEVIDLSRGSLEEVIWEVTNGFSEAYISIIDELKSDQPDYIICPVGSGEAFVGLYQGIIENGLKTKLVGVGVKKHPSFADKLSTPWTPYTNKILEITSGKHEVIRLTEVEVEESYKVNKNKCSSEPSATVVWEALRKKDIKSDKSVVLINSGLGLI